MLTKENLRIVATSVVLSVIISLVIGSMMNKSQKMESFISNIGTRTVGELREYISDNYQMEISIRRIRQILKLLHDGKNSESGKEKIKDILRLLSTNQLDNYISKALKGDYDDIIIQIVNNNYVQSRVRDAINK